MQQYLPQVLLYNISCYDKLIRRFITLNLRIKFSQQNSKYIILCKQYIIKYLNNSASHTDIFLCSRIHLSKNGHLKLSLSRNVYIFILQQDAFKFFYITYMEMLQQSTFSSVQI